MTRLLGAETLAMAPKKGEKGKAEKGKAEKAEKTAKAVKGGVRQEGEEDPYQGPLLSAKDLDQI